MKRTALQILEKQQALPILIVDKEGLIGEDIANKLKDEFLLVFVSQKNPEISDNLVHIPYLKKFPTIPDNKYSLIILADEKTVLPAEILNAFIKKSQTDNTPLIFIFNKKYLSEESLRNLLTQYNKLKIAITGDVFAKDYIYDLHSRINKFIYQIKTKGKITIPGDGTAETSPVLLNDVSEGILEIAFGGDDNTRLFYLFPKHAITLLSLAYLFIKIDPDIKLDLIKEDAIEQNNFIPPSEGKYLFGDSYNLQEKIKSINMDKIPDQKIREEPEIKKAEKKISPYFPYVIFMLALLLMPLISTLLFSFVGVASLYTLKDNLEKGTFLSSKPTIALAAKSFEISFDSALLLNQEAGLLGQQGLVDGLTNNIKLGSDISNASLSLINASETMKKVISGESKNPSADFNNASVELKNALYVYDKEKQKNLVPLSLAQRFDGLTNMVSSTINFWPDLLGFKGQKTYLVLFQNNMELRPGGGFIGSYGILTINMGKITAFKIYDVYDADGQLKAHVEPPFAIRRYLPSAHWYLRDSNFNVDFSKGAVASAVFLNSEMHQTVDGVIGVDLSFVKELLAVVGPVNVIDYNKTVNSDNFFQVTQNEVENNFFPGSTQKKDFLRSFYNSLSIKISQEKNISYLNLLEVLSNSIYEKHILFSFNKPGEETVFAVNGWSSSLIDTRTVNDSTINDFVGINEANLGVDKVNYYISRSISQKVSLENDGTVSEILTVAFKNSAPQNAWTGGLYKNYLRLILPLNSEITSINIDGKDQKIVPAVTDPSIYEKKNFVAPAGLEVEKVNQQNNTIYGFLVSLMPGDLRTIKVTYNLSQKINMSNPEIFYDLKIFKQPGVDFFPYSMSFSAPKAFKLISYPADVQPEKGSAILSTEITRDREVNLSLGLQ